MKLYERNLTVENGVYPRLVDAVTREYICSFRTTEQANEVILALSLAGKFKASLDAISEVDSAINEMRAVVQKHINVIESDRYSAKVSLDESGD